MKFIRNHWPWLLVILAIWFLLHNYMQIGVPYTHDGENHLARFANYKIALREGQLPPRWAPNLMNRYGYPVFNYNYPLANILSLPGSLIKLNYEVTFKALMSLSIIFGAVGGYLWLNRVDKSISRWAKVIAISSWVSSIYLINLINFRGNIGEVMAYALFPWMLWVIESILASPQWSWRRFGIWSVLTAAFLLSHNISAVFAVPILVIYAMFRMRTNYRSLLIWLSSLLVGILLSLWFWLPALAEKSMIVLDQAKNADQFAQHFPKFNQLLFSPVQFGFSYPGVVDSLSFQIGWPFLVSILLGLVLIGWQRIIKDCRVHHQLVMVLLLLALLVVLFQLKQTEPIWQLIPLANFIQFPWRLSLYLPTLLLVPMVWIWAEGGRFARSLLVIGLAIQLGTAVAAQPADFFHRTNVDYDDYGQSTSSANENLTSEIHFENIADWNNQVAALNSAAEITIISWFGSHRRYQVRIFEKATIVEPTMAFPGWETTVIDDQGNKYQANHINNDQIAGRLAYELDPGSYTVESRFTQHTWARQIGNWVSLLAISGLVVIIAWEFFKNAKN